MYLTRAPRHPALRGVVSLLWAGGGAGPTAMERVVPNGGLHLAWRDGPIRLQGQVERHGVLGGVRQTAHIHDTPSRYRSVGVLLVPGATQRLFGHPARVFAESHVGLDALWPDAVGLSDRLFDGEADPLDALEATLVTWLRPSRQPSSLPYAVDRLRQGLAVGVVAREVGRSPRTLRGWFDDAVGCAPAVWVRLARLQGALRIAADEPDWSTVAFRAGYTDQAHLCREVRRITGVTPTVWRERSGTEPNHIRIPPDEAVRVDLAC